MYKIVVQQVAATMPQAAVHRAVENRTGGIQFTLARRTGSQLSSPETNGTQEKRDRNPVTR